jgi:poly(3-hydroxybutyrate) depolymerase
MAAAGFAVISADYRLLSPCTGRDVLDDIVDLFAFIARTKHLGTVQVDSTRLVTAGNSAGGLCAFLAAIHANPKPRAILSMYGLGGELLVCFILYSTCVFISEQCTRTLSMVCCPHITVTSCPIAEDEALLPRLRAP